MRYYFDTIGIVAAVQRGIEEHFCILWNNLEKKPYQIYDRSNIWRVLIDPLPTFDPQPASYPDEVRFHQTEDIKLHKFLYGPEEHYHTFVCGYGQKSGQFVYGQITSTYGHVLVGKHYAN